jgi:hypothetical protein
MQIHDTSLSSQFEALDSSIIETMNRPGGLHVTDLLSLIRRPIDYTVDRPYEVERNEVVSASSICDDVTKIYVDAVNNKEIAFCNGSLFIHKSNFNEVKQFKSIVLTPDNRIDLDDGKPIFHDCGNAETLVQLIECGSMKSLTSSGCKYIVITPANISQNLTDVLPVLIGSHIVSGSPVTSCVTSSSITTNDMRDILCNNGGINQFVQQFRLSHYTDAFDFPLRGTDVFIVNTSLDFSQIKWSWHRRKTVDETKQRAFVNYQRSLNDLTTTFATRFVEV